MNFYPGCELPSILVTMHLNPPPLTPPMHANCVAQEVHLGDRLAVWEPVLAVAAALADIANIFI